MSTFLDGQARGIINNQTSKIIQTVDRFYAEVVFRLRRKSTNEIETMGVSMENGGTLYYNPQFVVDNADIIDKVLIHECFHIICEHIWRGQSMGLNKQFLNYCADLAVNTVILDFPDTLQLRDKDGNVYTGYSITIANLEKNYPDLLPGKPFEWYVDYFKQKGMENEEEGEGKSSDDHSQWSKTSSQESQAAARRLISDAITGSKQAGRDVPHEVRPYVEQLMNTEVPWETVLRQFPDTAETYAREIDRMKRNRRYGTMYPGQRKLRKCKIAIGFDVSGSISDEIVTLFGAVCEEIYQAGAEMVVLFFDDKVYPPLEYTTGCFENNLPGGGGTLAQPVLDTAAEMDVDGIIFLTDCMFADKLEQPAFPVVFAVLEGYKCNETFGQSVTIK